MQVVYVRGCFKGSTAGTKTDSIPLHPNLRCRLPVCLPLTFLVVGCYAAFGYLWGRNRKVLVRGNRPVYTWQFRIKAV